MYAFILLGGASAWYLLYKSCCSKNRAEENSIDEEPVEVIVKEETGEAGEVGEAREAGEAGEARTDTHKAACKLVAKKMVDTLIHDVVEQIDKNGHKIKLQQVHQDLNQNYPKYLHHKILQELNNGTVNVSNEEGSEEGSLSSEESLWDDLGEESVAKKPLFNSRMIYADEDIGVEQVKYWFDASGKESLLTYDQLVEQNGVFNVKRINTNNSNYYFLLFSTKEKQE